MENEQTSVENPLPPRKGKMKFLLLALAPMPLGLLIGPKHFAAAFLTKPGVLMNTFNIIAIVCLWLAQLEYLMAINKVVGKNGHRNSIGIDSMVCSIISRFLYWVQPRFK